MQVNNNWLDTETSFYKNHLDKVGEPLIFRQILYSRSIEYLPVITQLKKLDRNNNYEIKKKQLKSLLACFSLNLMEDRTKVKSYSGLMQFDFDNVPDIEETRQAIFALPFIAFVSKSCSGYGLYAFAAIAEPLRLKEYAEHIFEIFKYYHIPIDEGKGKNHNELRYCSYDQNMDHRENPVPLKIKNFYKKTIKQYSTTIVNGDGLINWAIREIQNAQPGQRFETVRKVSYTLGGTGTGLNEIKNTILQSQQYAGEENEFIKHIDKCFSAGQLKPMT